MAGKRSKVSQTNETIEESVHELGKEETLDRGAQGANRSDEDTTFRVDENETIRATEGVATRSRGNTSQPPRTTTTSRSQGGAANRPPRTAAIRTDGQNTTRSGKEPMTHSYRPGTSARPGPSTLPIREGDDDHYDPAAPVTEGDLSRFVEMWDRLFDELAAQRQESSILRQNLTAMDRRLDELARQRASPVRPLTPAYSSSSEESPRPPRRPYERAENIEQLRFGTLPSQEEEELGARPTNRNMDGQATTLRTRGMNSPVHDRPPQPRRRTHTHDNRGQRGPVQAPDFVATPRREIREPRRARGTDPEPPLSLIHI